MTRPTPHWSRRDAIIGGLGVFGAMTFGAACSSGSKADVTGTTTSKPKPSSSTSGANSSTPACVLTPEQTEGPFHIDDDLVRADITEGRPGAALELEFVVVTAGTCTPTAGVALDIWHCDALGEYSGYGANPSPTPGHAEPVNGSRFLRGTQVTAADGRASFRTIVPGWYPGRAVHIHVKARPSPVTEATTQVYFPEAALDAIYDDAPYSDHRGTRTPNIRDNIFGRTGGPPPLTLAKSGSGYRTTFTMGIAG